ncbi:MAG: glycogen/starch/alpha-glucan phosphorylase, partial [Clostridiales bacterium]|nr:glycogen/starch/alpha-glucan phosphorylase [Clostridiales bacterium]
MNLNMLFKNETDLKNAIINKLKIQFGKNIEDTSNDLIYQACALVVRDQLLLNMAI